MLKFILNPDEPLTCPALAGRSKAKGVGNDE